MEGPPPLGCDRGPTPWRPPQCFASAHLLSTLMLEAFYPPSFYPSFRRGREASQFVFWFIWFCVDQAIGLSTFQTNFLCHTEEPQWAGQVQNNVRPIRYWI